MVIDTSAICALLFNEEEALAVARAINGAERRLVSAATYVEAATVLLRRFGPDGVRDLDAFLYRSGVEVYPVTPAQARVAVRAITQYGRGRHRAGLNFGDCFSYALAKTTGDVLLFKDEDFTATDIDPAAAL